MLSKGEIIQWDFMLSSKNWLDWKNNDNKNNNERINQWKYIDLNEKY